MPTDIGLQAVLPASYWVCLALLLSGFVLAVWGERISHWLAAANLAALVVALYGIGVAGTSYPRGTVPWRHVGVAAELAGTRVVDTSIDAYFGWPGFFALLASFTGMSGLEDGQSLMKWAPVVNELLFVLPLLVLLRTLTTDERLVWSAVVLFALTNWVDQDYLAPQAMSFFLYLCLLGILLTFFHPPTSGRAGPEPTSWRGRPLRRGWPAVVRTRTPTRARRALQVLLERVRGPGPSHRAVPPAALGADSRVRALLLVVGVIAAVISMHQLTPFAVVLALAALALSRRTDVRGLPLVTGILVVTWLSYSAASYLQGNLSELLAGVGDVAGAAQGGLVDRIQGSPGHLVVVRGRLLFSLVVWGLAGLAVLLLYRRGQRDTTPVLLLASPAPLFAMQSYGGEMLLRIFMFSLPFACLLAVQLLPRASTPRRRRVAGGVLLLVGLLLSPAFVLVHYGNQLVDRRSTAEMAAVAELYRLAPPEALLVAGNDNTAWRYTEYGEHRHVPLERMLREEQPQDAQAVVRALQAELSRHEAGAFVFLTRQQQTYERLLGRRTPYTLAEVEQQLVASPLFDVAFRNEDAVVLTLSGRSR